jgi:hypothetical protein
MKMVENFERGRRLWIEWSCRPPANAKKLYVQVDAVTSTLINGDMMNAIGMNNPKGHVGG